MKILVTGGCGFIGSNFIRHMLKNTKNDIINLDALTYSGNIKNLEDITKDKRYKFVHGKIEDGNIISEIIPDIDYIVNFAAETHVDRSINNSKPFITTNIEGTHNILEACRKYDIKKIVHISTDEVYGELGEHGKFVESLPLLPNSPYSASKASADLIIRAYCETYGLRVSIARPSNNYGYCQYPEKFIPLIITNLLENRPVPVYGEGKNVRDWIFVEDCCSGIDAILNKGKIGEIYNIGGENEKRNIDIVKHILTILGKDERYIKFVKDRPGHDYRYALDNSKIKKELNWSPKINLDIGLMKTVQWYKDNISWWKSIRDKLDKESKGFWT